MVQNAQKRPSSLKVRTMSRLQTRRARGHFTEIVVIFLKLQRNAQGHSSADNMHLVAAGGAGCGDRVIEEIKTKFEASGTFQGALPEDQRSF